jgi:CBS domain-containing protein
MLVPIFSSKIHRAVVVGEDDKLIAPISQSDMIKFVADYFKTQKFGKKTLGELNIINRNVFGVYDTDPVIRAFKIISTKGYSAVPILDKDLNLVGNLSASDIKGFAKDKLLAFTQEIRFFLQDHSKESLKPITVTEKSSLNECLNILSSGPHRVWVVKDKKPIGVVSMTDIFVFIRDLKE